ncbi:unnamed protein product [Rotaria socialis]|uniref:Uncharacterized protein n=1 Tax=Rotaria socialis TaxID=392032 RepID=A0A820XUI6_9BILA|nr:unnamed protein product [Rotaria socialis]CAF4538430.1 unnamed protein product [Rotaria socialis]
MNPNHLHYNPNGNAPLYDRTVPNTQNLTERRIDSTTNRSVVWEPYGINTPRGVVTNNEPMQTQNPNQRRIDSTTNQTVVWEPYGIKNPRRAVTNDELMQTQNSKIDEDWLHAYATFSPYRTSNQDYGYRTSNIHFIPNQPNSYNQVPNDPRQNSMNVNTSDRDFPQSSMLNLLAKNGLPPLAYRPSKRSQDA